MVWQKIKNSLPINILIGICALAICIGAYRLVAETFGLRQEYEANQKKIEELKKKKEELEARLIELKNPAVVEREAKERLNLKRPGEEVVVVVPENIATTSAATSSKVWQRITSFFKKFSR